MIARDWQPYWILDDDDEPVAVDDVRSWAMWMERQPDRHVLDDYPSRTIRVSTVFLGLDQNHFGEGPPVLWETMIFGGAFHHYQRRYRTRLDACRGHQIALGLVEQFRTAPRRTKKALRKYAESAAMRTGDLDRAARALRRIA